MNMFQYNSFRTAQTIEEVMEQMHTLDIELAGTDMQDLIAFNHTYLIITRNVYAKLDTSYFENDNLMRRIDTCFGNYYFKALHDYIQGKECAPAWKTLFDACRKDTTFQFIYMALGVNAHVNNDLPQTLHDVMKGNTVKTDYDRINDIIAYSLAEVIDSLQEKHTILRLSERMGKSGYSFFLNRTIRKWRNNAWKNYLELYVKKIKKEKFEITANDIAIQLASIRQSRDIPQIIRVLR